MSPHGKCLAERGNEERDMCLCVYLGNEFINTDRIGRRKIRKNMFCFIRDDSKKVG